MLVWSEYCVGVECDLCWCGVRVVLLWSESFVGVG